MKDLIFKKLFKNGKFNDRAVRSLTEVEVKFLLSQVPQVSSVTEAVYWIKNNLIDYPNKCLNCGNAITKFTSYNQGYTKLYCSGKCSNSSSQVKEAKRQTSLQKYGTDSPLQSTLIKEKIKAKQIERNVDNLQTVIGDVEKQGFKLLEWDTTSYSNLAKLQCPDNHIFDRNITGWNRWIITCPQCAKNRSRGEVDVEKFIESLGVKTQSEGKRKLLGNGSELDIYCPDFNFAVEYNGVYFHSSNDIDDKNNKIRHIKKQDLAEENSIKLIQVWDLEWELKQEIVKSRIKNQLGVSCKVMARKCKIVEIDAKTSRAFQIANHLQGAGMSSVNLGLMFEDELVSLMTFSKARFNKEYEWELIRFCNKLNLSVVGGAGKLLHYFKKQYQPKSIVSYADRRWSNGNLYVQLGFTFLHKSAPCNYFWRNGSEIHHRLKFQKHKLPDVLEVFDETKTAKENIFANGWKELWDCGNLTYGWKND